MPERTNILSDNKIVPASAFTDILSSQATAGKDIYASNVQRLPIQRKLSIGAVDDPMEYEADATADTVMRMPEPNFIQRKCGHCEEEEAQRKPPASFIQRKETANTNTVGDATHNQIQATRGGGSAMQADTKTFMESRFSANFSNVRIHSGTYASQLSSQLNAQAFTVGKDIYFNDGKFSPNSSEGKHLLAHELTHTMQQSDPGKITQGINRNSFIQRAIRINGGKLKINEADYQTGGPKEKVGTKFKVKDLLTDKTKRVFKDTAEVEQYANGAADYIGDIKPFNKNVFWYRLPNNDLTVLGEQHQNPDGNVEDIIVGLGTKRFMYEPFHEFKEIQPLKGSVGTGTSTTTALLPNEQKYRVGPLADYVNFSSALENIVIKAFTGASMYKQFLGDKSGAEWGSRKTTTDYSFGDRIALYFSFAIHIASDIAGYTFPPKKSNESHYIKFGRLLQDYYKKNKKVLDAFSAGKDADELIGIADIFKKFKATEANVYQDFADIFEQFGAGYIEQLGIDTGNVDLTKDGEDLFKQKNKGLGSFSPAREEIIKERVKIAKAGKYLIAGMGDAHHTNLTPWLDKNKIAHTEVASSLLKQESDNSSKWVP